MFLFHPLLNKSKNTQREKKTKNPNDKTTEREPLSSLLCQMNSMNKLIFFRYAIFQYFKL